MKSASLRILPLPLACMMALHTSFSYAQASSVDTPPAPYEIPLSIQKTFDPTVEAHPTNPYWVPNTPENPHPNETYQWYRLKIGLGVNGGAPVQLDFDTGSTAFNIDAGKNYLDESWLPLLGATAPKLGQSLYYGDGTYGNQRAQTLMPSVEFYKIADDLKTTTRVSQFEPGQGIPVSLKTRGFASGKSLGSSGKPGEVIGYVIRLGVSLSAISLKTYENLKSSLRTAFLVKNAIPLYEDLGFQDDVSDGKISGIFGAGPFGAASVLGQMTASGYVVAANAQIGDPKDCGSCAHVIMNLNPAIRAQFSSIVPWDGGARGTFPVSGAPVQAKEYGQLFTYVLGNGKSITLPTLLDSGTPELGAIYDDGVLAREIAAGHIDPNAHPNDAGTGNAQGNVAANLTLKMTGATPGAAPTVFTTENPYFGNTARMLTVDAGGRTPEMVSGIQFFFANSVMYDLQNMSTGYTPFFVSVAPISTNGAGYAVTDAMAAQGIAGVISGSGPLTINKGAAAQLSNSNSYTGATRVLKDGWLGLAGP